MEVKMQHVNKKPLAKKLNLVLTKKNRPRMNYERRTIKKKKSDPKNPKHSKNQSEIAACEQKITSEKANYWPNTALVFFHLTIAFTLAKNFTWELEQLRWRSNDADKCEKITWEVKECSKTKAETRSSKKFA